MPKYPTESPDEWKNARRSIVRDSLGIALASGAYATSFGAISISSGLTGWQTMVLSLLMFTGGSQFGLVGVVAGGGSAWAGAATAVMLGARNAFYGLRLSGVLGAGGWRRFLVAHLVIDESSAMSMGRESPRASRLGFYATGLSLFLCWNVGTAVGVVGASALSSPRVLGLDAAVPAVFLALLAPRLRGREPWAVSLAAGLIAIVATPLVPPGIPVLLAAAFGIAVAARPRDRPGRKPRSPDANEAS